MFPKNMSSQVLIEFNATCEGRAYSCLQVVEFSRWLKLLTDASFKCLLPLFSCAQNGDDACYSFPSQHGLSMLCSRYLGLEKCQHQVLNNYTCQVRVSMNQTKVMAYRQLCGDRLYCGTCDFVTTCEELVVNLDNVLKELMTRLTPPKSFSQKFSQNLSELFTSKSIHCTLGDLCIALAKSYSSSNSSFESMAPMLECMMKRDVKPFNLPLLSLLMDLNSSYSSTPEQCNLAFFECAVDADKKNDCCEKPKESDRCDGPKDPRTSDGPKDPGKCDGSKDPGKCDGPKDPGTCDGPKEPVKSEQNESNETSSKPKTVLPDCSQEKCCSEKVESRERSESRSEESSPLQSMRNVRNSTSPV
jgi:hypothetical protein